RPSKFPRGLVDRTRARTRVPRSIKARTTDEPRKPEPPVTSTRTPGCKEALIENWTSSAWLPLSVDWLQSTARPAPRPWPGNKQRKPDQRRHRLRPNEPIVVSSEAAIVLLQAELHEVTHPELDGAERACALHSEIAVVMR